MEEKERLLDEKVISHSYN